MVRHATLACVLVCSAAAVQNPFGFLKTSSQKGDQFAVTADASTVQAAKIQAKPVVGHHDHSEKHAKKEIQAHKAEASSHNAEAKVEKDAIQRKKEELTRRVADVSTQEHAELGAPCEGDPAVCKTMCRWLKMSNKDVNENCKLFEWQLRSCNYTAIEERPANSAADPMDCAVNYLRTTVVQEEVAGYISAIDICTESLPPRVNETCYVALGLLRGEVHDWKAENELRLDAAALGDDLDAAAKQGIEALRSKKKEQEAIDALTKVLAKAEELPGHYLVDQVAKARGILDTLGPIPAVRNELADAMADSEKDRKSVV